MRTTRHRPRTLLRRTALAVALTLLALPLAGALAQRTTVVAYDRAGYAWSEPSAEPRTGEAVVADLRAALGAAGLRGPSVVVGHSMGGLFARLLAERAPEEVAGLAHLVPRDRPDVVVEQVLEVLDEVRADGGAGSAWTAGRG